MTDGANEDEQSRVAADCPNERLVSHCQKCGDRLTDHEDEGKALCRWCVTGWEPEKQSSNMVYDEKGQLVYG
jgi:hypothetical protein